MQLLQIYAMTSCSLVLGPTGTKQEEENTKYRKPMLEYKGSDGEAKEYLDILS